MSPVIHYDPVPFLLGVNKCTVFQLNNSVDSTGSPDSHPKKKKRPRDSKGDEVSLEQTTVNNEMGGHCFN